ncbi:uncharacterized protein ColSpa_04968 [Colletotrichum spaethianum]|uniref:Uncharacterized protein n=1 Tax=Colletotrichum spaethianum TaxID=700344 RepID=A0AA37LIQ2_9PEZI|nr:uncharacterized protein ColSpa_04968 [Colletotrichum spaethianum]GKT44787.1 hypothetical protein ColSpa_04968 [Colletotrichum spaethianum]
MDAGGLAQMNSNNFSSANGLAMPGGGLASRRGGPVKPLSLSNAAPTSNAADNGAPTPRTSRSHLLAGLRTAPKSATAANFSGANNGFYVDQGQNDHQQAQIAQLYAALAQQQHQHQQAPRVQVSPPPENHASPFRTATPPKRYESPSEVAPLPPPSANAFRRGHKKVMSLALNGQPLALPRAPKSAGPKTASFPLTPLSGGYGPGQGRAGEHPVRQPRGPPSIEELKAKPTAKHEGSKNFATRTRRSAVHNLVRAGRERRKGTGSSNGSMSPVSESAEEESGTPITDNESDSGRSGSGSLAGDIDCSLPSSRTSTNGSWGAIGSDRPSSRQRARKSLDSVSSNESGENSFASVFKNSAQRAGIEVTDGQRKAPMLVLTSAEKRKSGILA